MEKSMIVINDLSGKSDCVDSRELAEKYAEGFSSEVLHIKSPSEEWSPDGFDRIIVCGGDGTFNRAINKQYAAGQTLIYVSCGTFNEYAKTHRVKAEKGALTELSEYITVNNEYFAYVCAAGSFTPRGYIVPPEVKKKLGIGAYLSKVVGQYKVHNVPAEIVADGKTFSGSFTLIMAIDSRRCFGLNFNHMYREGDGITHLLLIPAPKGGKDNFLSRAKIFFPLFRAFFLGFRKERNKKGLTFVSAKDIKIRLQNPVDFDIDGDKRTLSGDVHITVNQPAYKIFIGQI
jgi:diacylglycerol kinase family enzyme